MLWRAPWIRGRIGLTALAAWDGLTLYVSYNLVYLVRLGDWPGVNTALATVILLWISVSYLVGNYSAEGISSGERFIADWRLVTPGTVVAVGFVLHSWLYQVVNAQTRFRGFLIPFVLIAITSSLAGRAVIAYKKRRRKQWLLYASDIEREIVVAEAKRDQMHNDVLREIRMEQILNENRSTEKTGDEGFGIIVGSSHLNEDELNQELLERRQRGEDLISLVNWCERELYRIPPEIISTKWFVLAEGFTLRPGGISWRVKRFCDVLGSLVLLIATTPIIVLCALMIWTEDRGPILYSQERTGLYGKVIKIHKLRSMRVGSEKKGAMWSYKGDPRVTRIGKILRALRIDELPQLVGVLKGDLSLIGPRPERPEIEKELERRIAHYRVRHWIRPGLSGWAQVSYPYGASVEDSRIKLSYDLFYIRNGGLLLDLLILLKTLRLVASASGSIPREP